MRPRCALAPIRVTHSQAQAHSHNAQARRKKFESFCAKKGFPLKLPLPKSIGGYPCVLCPCTYRILAYTHPRIYPCITLCPHITITHMHITHPQPIIAHTQAHIPASRITHMYARTSRTYHPPSPLTRATQACMPKHIR